MKLQFNYQAARAKISGESLSIVGTVNVNVVGGASNTDVSGQSVYLVNDGIHNVVQIAGGVNLSGQTVYIPNDSINNVVQISGQKIGGWPNDSINNVVNISGGLVRIGGNVNTSPVVVNAFNNDAGAVGNNVLNVAAYTMGYHVTNNSWARVNVVTPISGEGYKLLVAVSGQNVGFMNDGKNNVVTISGQNVYSYGSTVKTNAMVSCIATSGGTNLPNIACVKAYVRSMSGNDVMFVGGTGAQAPFSGTGLELYGGEVLPLDISNTNQVNVMAVVANQKVSVLAVAQ